MACPSHADSRLCCSDWDCGPAVSEAESRASDSPCSQCDSGTADYQSSGDQLESALSRGFHEDASLAKLKAQLDQIQAHFDEQQRTVAELRYNNSMLTALNAALGIECQQLRSVTRAAAYAQAANAMHLRILLPCWNGTGSGSSEDTTSHEAISAAALTQPILHLWVNSAMPCGTLRASLPQFLHSAPVDDQCPPHTRDWVLTKPGSGTLLHDLESPLSLGLADGAMLVAMPAAQCYAPSS